MTKTLIVAALLSSFAAVSFAQASAPMAADGASAPAKHMKAKKAKKAKQGRFGRRRTRKPRLTRRAATKLSSGRMAG